MGQTALITGASSGIGAEFAQQLAGRGYDVILVARNGARLHALCRELHARHGINAEYLAVDLLSEGGLAVVMERIADQQRPVEVLVNNAGFGLMRDFARSNLDDELRHLDLLVAVPVKLCHTALRAMLVRRSGHIINVASIAGFTTRGSYGAAKAYMINLSRWANIMYRSRGLTVTAVCPGFVRTEFHQRMGATMSRTPRVAWVPLHRVVREGLDDAFKGKGISIPTWRYKVVAFFTSHGPQNLVVRLATGKR